MADGGDSSACVSTMKFGSKLLENAVDGWEPHYLDYLRLKEVIGPKGQTANRLRSVGEDDQLLAYVSVASVAPLAPSM